MIDIDELIKGLDGFILSISSESVTKSSTSRKTGIVGIDVSLRISPLELDTPPLHPSLPPQSSTGFIEPLIDVIEDEKTLRVVALIPGIREENIRYRFRERILELEIVKDCTYRKEIKCSSKPEQISVKSTSINNSVLEIVFAKNVGNKEGISSEF